jgi:hypothetical protein
VTLDENGHWKIVRNVGRGFWRGPGFKELLANIRRLMIAVLDNLEEGSRGQDLGPGAEGAA